MGLFGWGALKAFFLWMKKNTPLSYAVYVLFVALWIFCFNPLSFA